jgi:hypothetical protein
MCPEPRIISDLNEIYSAFERIHHWQRQTVDLGGDGTHFIVGYAKDMFDDKNIEEKYNELVGVLSNIAPDEHAPEYFIPPPNTPPTDTDDCIGDG